MRHAVRHSLRLSSWVLALSLSPALVAVEKPTWPQKMQELSKTITELLPDITRSNAPTDTEKKRLEKNAKKLARLAHTIKMPAESKEGVVRPDTDPTLTFVSGLFAADAKLAYNAIHIGNYDYGKSTLRTLTSYCVACHTRTDKGPQFPKLDVKMDGLAPIEKGRVLAATRQFDAALAEFEKIIADPKTADSNPFGWGTAMRHALTIAIRVKKDPAVANAVLAKAKSLPRVPPLFAAYLPSWQASIDEWKSEKKAGSSEEDLYSLAKKLSARAVAEQTYPFDHRLDVLYLRISETAHDLLGQYPKSPHAPEALLMIGNAYGLLSDRFLSPLPEMYYAACVRLVPHSDMAEQCFQRYEETVHFGYSGSAGTMLPADTSETLEQLRKLGQKAP